MAIVVLLQASDFESDENYFRGFLHRYSFPYFLTRFLTDFFLWQAGFNGELLSHPNKTNWPWESIIKQAVVKRFLADGGNVIGWLSLYAYNYSANCLN